MKITVFGGISVLVLQSIVAVFLYRMRAIGSYTLLKYDLIAFGLPWLVAFWGYLYFAIKFLIEGKNSTHLAKLIAGVIALILAALVQGFAMTIAANFLGE